MAIFRTAFFDFVAAGQIFFTLSLGQGMVHHTYATTVLMVKTAWKRKTAGKKDGQGN